MEVLQCNYIAKEGVQEQAADQLQENCVERASALEEEFNYVKKEGVQEQDAVHLQDKTTATEVSLCNHVEKEVVQKQAADQPKVKCIEEEAAMDKTGEAFDKERHEGDDKEDEDFKVEPTNMDALKKIMDEVAAGMYVGEQVFKVFEVEIPEEEEGTEDVENNDEEVAADKDAPGKETKKEQRKKSTVGHRIGTDPGISEDEVLQAVEGAEQI